MFRIAQRDPKQQKLVKIRLEFFENVLKTKIAANSRIVNSTVDLGSRAFLTLTQP